MLFPMLFVDFCPMWLPPHFLYASLCFSQCFLSIFVQFGSRPTFSMLPYAFPYAFCRFLFNLAPVQLFLCFPMLFPMLFVDFCSIWLPSSFLYASLCFSLCFLSIFVQFGSRVPLSLCFLMLFPMLFV